MLSATVCSLRRKIVIKIFLVRTSQLFYHVSSWPCIVSIFYWITLLEPTWKINSHVHAWYNMLFGHDEMTRLNNHHSTTWLLYLCITTLGFACRNVTCPDKICQAVTTCWKYIVENTCWKYNIVISTIMF